MGDAHAHQLVTGYPGHVRPLVHDGTAFRRDQAGYGVQGGGFPRSVGADQRDDLPLVDLKGDPFYGLDYAVVDFQTFDFQHSHLVPLLLIHQDMP